MSEVKKQKTDGPVLHFNHIRRFSVVISITLAIVLLFGGIGYWLDTKFDTKPWLLVIGVLFSFPVTQYALYRKMKTFTHEEIERQRKKLAKKSD